MMSLGMIDRVMGYQSFQGASTPANVSASMCENGRRKEGIWQQQALQTPPFSASTSCACGLPSMASPPLPQCGCYACSHSLCL